MSCGPEVNILYSFSKCVVFLVILINVIGVFCLLSVPFALVKGHCAFYGVIFNSLRALFQIDLKDWDNGH